MTATDKDKEAIEAGLVDNPEDWTLRRVLADWYEDKGMFGEAEALRWMADNKRRPWLNKSMDRVYWSYASEWNHKNSLHSWLPDKLFSKLRGRHEKYADDTKVYKSRKDAEDAFIRAWIRWDKKGRP